MSACNIHSQSRWNPAFFWPCLLLVCFSVCLFLCFGLLLLLLCWGCIQSLVHAKQVLHLWGTSQASSCPHCLYFLPCLCIFLLPLPLSVSLLEGWLYGVTMNTAFNFHAFFLHALFFLFRNPLLPQSLYKSCLSFNFLSESCLSTGSLFLWYPTVVNVILSLDLHQPRATPYVFSTYLINLPSYFESCIECIAYSSLTTKWWPLQQWLLVMEGEGLCPIREIGRLITIGYWGLTKTNQLCVTMEEREAMSQDDDHTMKC